MINNAVKLTKKELERIPVLEKIINNNLNITEWAKIMKISYRQSLRLVNKYKEGWVEALIHKGRWQSSNHKSKDYSTVKDIIKDPIFQWFWPTLLLEELKESHKIEISCETLRKLMIQQGLWYSKTKHKHIFRIRRPRKDCLWELIQFDWSYHKRLEDRDWGDEYCLLLAIDDATWKAMHAALTDNEWYFNVTQFWIEYVRQYWIPINIYLDKFSTYKVNNHPKATYEKDLVTQFDRSMKTLWCNLIFASSPQAKWRVEKANHTFQDRFIKKLRLQWINNIKQANEYLQNVFIPQFNTKFSVPAKSKLNLHKLTTYSKEDLAWIFAKQETRKLSNDFIIQYKTRVFQVSETQWLSLYPKKILIVSERIDTWEIYITKDNKPVNFKEVDYATVRMRRAIHYKQINDLEKQKTIIAMEQRKQDKFKESKKKQIKYKIQRLLEKIE